MSSSNKHFRDLLDPALQEWRQLLPTALLLDSLRTDQRACEEESMSEAIDGNTASAAAWAGRAAAYMAIIRLIEEKRVPSQENAQDSTWRDPAARRKAPDA